MTAVDHPTGVRDRLVHLIDLMSEDEQGQLLQNLEDFRASERRRHERKPYFVPVDYVADKRVHMDFIRNISVGGVFIETREPLSLGQDVVMTFSFPAPRGHLKIRGRIVSKNENGLGVEFDLSEQKIVDTLMKGVDKI